MKSFNFAVNGFHNFENNWSQKMQKLFIFMPFFLVFCRLVSYFHYEPRAKILTFDEGVMGHYLRWKIWLYRFDIVFLQVLIEIFCCLFVLIVTT